MKVASGSGVVHRVASKATATGYPSSHLRPRIQHGADDFVVAVAAAVVAGQPVADAAGPHSTRVAAGHFQLLPAALPVARFIEHLLDDRNRVGIRVLAQLSYYVAK